MLAAAQGSSSVGAPPDGSSELMVKAVSGSHVITINGYSLTKKVPTGDFITAATFDAAGHRWSILYYPNGSSVNNNDCISLYLMNLDPNHGPGNAVKAQFSFTLLGVDGQSFYTRSSDLWWGNNFVTMIEKRGFPFIQKTALEKDSSFIKDDCVTVRCNITVLKMIHKDTGGVVGDRFVLVPPSNIDRDLGHLLSSGKGADVTFEVDGETFAAHRNILAARSPVFMAEFFGPMKEKAADCVRIDDMEARVFEALLHFVYTDSLLPVVEQLVGESENMAMVQHLLVAADRYSLERLKLMCEDKLCNYIDTSTVGTILTLAEQHGCHGLKKACFRFLMSGNNLNAAIATDGFDHLTISCPSVLRELLAKVTL